MPIFKSSSESLHNCLNDLLKRIIYLNYNQIKLHCTSNLKVHLLRKLGNGCCSIHSHDIPDLLNWTTPFSTALQVTIKLLIIIKIAGTETTLHN